MAYSLERKISIIKTSLKQSEIYKVYYDKVQLFGDFLKSKKNIPDKDYVDFLKRMVDSRLGMEAEIYAKEYSDTEVDEFVEMAKANVFKKMVKLSNALETLNKYNSWMINFERELDKLSVSTE